MRSDVVSRPNDVLLEYKLRHGDLISFGFGLGPDEELTGTSVELRFESDSDRAIKTP